MMSEIHGHMGCSIRSFKYHKHTKKIHSIVISRTMFMKDGVMHIHIYSPSLDRTLKSNQTKEYAYNQKIK
jgi:hypothetical protein